MPVINKRLLCKLDIKILQATGIELIPVEDAKLILTLDNNSYYAIY